MLLCLSFTELIALLRNSFLPVTCLNIISTPIPPVPTTTPEEKKKTSLGRNGKEQKTKVGGGEGRGNKKRRNGAGKGRERKEGARIDRASRS